MFILEAYLYKDRTKLFEAELRDFYRAIQCSDDHERDFESSRHYFLLKVVDLKERICFPGNKVLLLLLPLKGLFFYIREAISLLLQWSPFQTLR